MFHYESPFAAGASWATANTSRLAPDVQQNCLISWVPGTVNKVVEDQVLDRTYAALADPTRRALLVALRAGAARITDLAQPLPISFAAVSRHVGVLEAAGLIRREKRGRDHWLTVDLDGLRQAERWISEQASFWSRSADALAERLERKWRQP
jgi:DNA-binding transcriptional ArsR family regulator